jgi:integrase/recombinase XerD
VSRSGFNIALCGLKFFYERTLHREWVILDLPRRTREKKLPVVFSTTEVGQILACLRRPRYRVCLTTIYSCGLRLLEGVTLQVADIDSARRMLHIRQGKGDKDRYVPLPEGTLKLLRDAGGVEYASPSRMALSGTHTRWRAHVVCHTADG